MVGHLQTGGRRCDAGRPGASAFWLAWPDLHRLPRWFWYVLPIGFLVLIYARTYLLFLIPLFVDGVFLYAVPQALAIVLTVFGPT